MIRPWPLLALLAVVPACEDKITYSYFLIQAKLDPATVDSSILDRIEACAVLAQIPGRGDDVADLRCRRRMVMNELGLFEYSTALTSGTVKFVLVANDFNGQRLAQGETAPLEIVVGKTVMAELVAAAVPGAQPNEDGGASPAAPDAGTSD